MWYSARILHVQQWCLCYRKSERVSRYETLHPMDSTGLIQKSPAPVTSVAQYGMNEPLCLTALSSCVETHARLGPPAGCYCFHLEVSDGAVYLSEKYPYFYWEVQNDVQDGVSSSAQTVLSVPRSRPAAYLAAFICRLTRPTADVWVAAPATHSAEEITAQLMAFMKIEGSAGRGALIPPRAMNDKTIHSRGVREALVGGRSLHLTRARADVLLSSNRSSTPAQWLPLGPRAATRLLAQTHFFSVNDVWKTKKTVNGGNRNRP